MEHNSSKALSPSPLEKQVICADAEKPKAVTLAVAPRLESMISDAAKAQGEDDMPEGIKSLAQSGLISPVSGLYRIVNRCNDCIFAGIHVDEKGNRSIHFRQQYTDRTYSPEFIIPQDSLFMVVHYRRTGNPALEQDAKKAMKAITREYLRKLSSNELLDIPEVLDALSEVLKNLPIVSREHELTAVGLYAEVIEILRNMGGAVPLLDTLRNEKRGYLVLDDSMVGVIAQELQMPRKQLLMQLKRYNLLYLTGSCQGYQSKIPYSSVGLQ